VCRAHGRRAGDLEDGGGAQSGEVAGEGGGADAQREDGAIGGDGGDTANFADEGRPGEPAHVGAGRPFVIGGQDHVDERSTRWQWAGDGEGQGRGLSTSIWAVSERPPYSAVSSAADATGSSSPIGGHGEDAGSEDVKRVLDKVLTSTPAMFS
jgi:hypothetical protein